MDPDDELVVDDRDDDEPVTRVSSSHKSLTKLPDFLIFVTPFLFWFLTRGFGWDQRHDWTSCFSICAWTTVQNVELHAIRRPLLLLFPLFILLY